MSLFSLLSIARQGTAAQTAALTTTGSNIANVATPGYTRRTALLESSGIGGGVDYVKTVRSFNQFAFGNVVDEAGKNSAATARSGALEEVEAAIAPATNSIGDNATELITSFNALAGSPTDPSLRADVLAKAENLTNNIRTTRNQLGAAGQTMLSQAQDTVTNVNAQLGHIADLNQQIATAEGAGGDSSGLRDQRDVAIRAVGEAMGARAIEDKTGRVTLFAAGTVLVEGDHANPLSMDLDPNGAMRFYVNGASKSEITSRVDTGTLGGVREARDTDLSATMQSLDSYAFDVANAFNAVHQQGYGNDGQNGRNLFTVSATPTGAAATIALDPSLDGHPELVGAAGSTSDLPGGNTIALQLAQLGDTQSFGGQTLPDRFASIATDIGFRKQNADNEAQLRGDTLASAESLADSANGVSIDEEMVNLTTYQRAFEASAKVLQTADTLLQDLMDAF